MVNAGRSGVGWVLGFGALLLGACGDDGGTGSGSSGDSTTVEASTSEPTSTGTTQDTVPTTTNPATTDPVTTGDDGTGTGSTTGTLPTTEPGCSDDGECPQGSGVCQQGLCQAGTCVVVDLPVDTPIADEPADCRRSACDGAGNLKEMPDDSDTPIDDPGNCKAAVCMGGAPSFVADDLDLPNDDVDCTKDLCDQGTPKFEPQPVNSFCGAMGAKFCHDDLTCQDCKQVSAACEDDSNSEANETQLGAHSLGTISDADSAGSFVCAVLDGADDVDWYRFNGNDVFLNFVDPTREVITKFNHRICVYLTCDNGPPAISCGGDETMDVAPLGQPGCCGTGHVSPSLNLTGSDDSATIWVKVENPDGLACVPYELTYHF